MKKLLFALIFAGLSSQALAQSSFTAKDATGITQTFKSVNCSPICPLSVPVDATGTPIWGTAGVANSNVMTVQGIASGTAMPISAASLPLPSGAATAAGLTTINGTLGTPFQAGGSIANTSFGISGTLPSFTTTQTVNLGTLNGVALDTSVQSLLTTFGLVAASPVANTVQDRLKTINTTLGTPFQVGGSIGNTTFAATQATASSLNATVVGTGTFATQLTGATNNINNITGTVTLPTGAATAAGLTTINTTLGSPFQVGSSIGNTTFASTQSGTWTVQPGNTANTTAWLVTGTGGTFPVTQATAANLNATIVGTGTFATQSTQSGTWTNRVLGSLGGTIDFAGQNATSPANSWLIGGQFNTTPTTITSGNVSPFQMDSAGNLLVNIKAGAAAGGTSSNFAAAFPSAGTAIGVKNGANMVNLTADGSSNLNVNCTVGCAGGSTSNASSGVATSSTNGQSVSWLYGFNGTTWDQLQVDASKFLKVAVQGTVPVSGTVTTTPPSNASTNIAQVSGTTTDTNSGVKSAGTLRVVLATDQPQLTNKLLVTPDSVALPANQSVNVSQINGVTPLMGNGVTGTGSQRVTIASDNTVFAVTSSSATAPVSTMNSASAAAGMTAANAMVFDDVSPTAITENSFGYQRMSANRNAYTTLRDSAGNERGVTVNANNALNTSIDQTTAGATNGVSPVANATGGSSTTGNIVANNTTAVVVKASAGTLYSIQMYGIGSAPAYLKIYNATSATCGSGTPIKRLIIPAASTAANGGGSNIDFGAAGVKFGTGITYCVTTGIGDADTTAPAASTFLVNLDWQ